MAEKLDVGRLFSLAGKNAIVTGAARLRPENHLRVTLTDCGSELSKLAGRGFDRVDLIDKTSVSRISTLKEAAMFKSWASSGPHRAPNTSV